ncbi:hypothetical protein T492DRAFT_1093574 [Pavlovales sp. CCMP2436]|nr:hypothetical protein T492DRAFT_1093574 [Pavlovales sp. CCMP2436]
MTLRDYLAYCEAEGAVAERPLYLFDKDFCSKCPAMVAEFETPAYFAQDLMAVLGEQRRPDYRWLIIGPALAGSSFHVDPNCNFAWNATVVGRKKWVFYPPDCAPPCSEEDERQLCLPRWFREHYDTDEHADVRLECVTEAGECIFVPRGWWHCVLNLELCVAVAHNVVTKHNLLPVLEWLEQPAHCAPWEGCRSNLNFNLSGDVPASVIYPYPSLVLADPPPAGEATEPTPAKGALPATDEARTCACADKRRALLCDLRAGLAQEHPGLVAELLAGRKQGAAAASSVWAKVLGGRDVAGCAGGDAATGPSDGGGFRLADMLGSASSSGGGGPASDEQCAGTGTFCFGFDS